MYCRESLLIGERPKRDFSVMAVSCAGSCCNGPKSAPKIVADLMQYNCGGAKVRWRNSAEASTPAAAAAASEIIFKEDSGAVVAGGPA